jgi:Domain of unknown function (DUF5979)
LVFGGPPVGTPVTASRTYPRGGPLPPLAIGGLAAGTTCTITEPQDGSSPALAVTTTPALPLTVTIGAGARETVTITDTYATAEGALIVVKEITGSAGGQQGAVDITATCGGTTNTFSVPAGATNPEPFTVTGLPAGISCTIAEPNDGSTPTIDVTTTPALPLTVSVPAGEAATATITDAYAPAPASITVTKVITGDAAGHGPSTSWCAAGPHRWAPRRARVHSHATS